MDSEYKVALVIGIISVIVISSFYVLNPGNIPYDESQIGGLQVLSYEDVSTKMGFPINKDCVGETHYGIYASNILGSDVYGCVRGGGTTVSINARAQIRFFTDARHWISTWCQISAYRFEYYWRDATHNWQPITTPLSSSFIVTNLDIATHTYGYPQPQTLSNPPHTVSISESFDTYFLKDYMGAGFAVRAQLYVKAHLSDVNEWVYIGSEEAYVSREDMVLTVRVDPAECWVTVQTGTTSTQQGYTIGKELSTGGIATFIIKEPASTMVFVTVEKGGYKEALQQPVTMEGNKEILIRIYQEVARTYNVTVRMTPAFSDAYLDGTFKHSLQNGIVTFDNVAPGMHTLTVENGDLWLPSTKTIIVDGDLDLTVNLEAVPTEINHPPVMYSIAELSGSEIGYWRGEYQFMIDASDEDMDSLSYAIDWGDGTTTRTTETSVSHSWNNVGAYVIKARAYDGDLWSDWSEYSFTISNTLKVLLETPENGMPGISYEFNAYPVSSNLQYKFDWGDGTTTGWISDSSAKKTYYSSDTFTVTVFATDGQSQVTTSKQFVVSVEGGKLPKPTIAVGNSEKGRPNTAKIEVVTDINTDTFDIYGSVMDSSGNFLYSWKALTKSGTGNSYVSLMTFTCNVVGEVRITAKTLPTSEITGVLGSDAVVKTSYCYLTEEEANGTPYGENPWDRNVTGQPEVEEGKEIPVGERYNPQYNTNKTPGFEPVTLLIAIALTILLLRWRTKKWEKK